MNQQPRILKTSASAPSIKVGASIGALLLLASVVLGQSEPKDTGSSSASAPSLAALPSWPKPGLLPGGAIFDSPTVLDFHLELGPTNLQFLRDHPREYTPARVVVNGKTYAEVGVKLKGAAGSFRSVDDHPAMTLSFSKFAERERFYGLSRIHLNNSVQDPTRMNEYLGSELFRAAGVPTPRVAWATVRLNDRDLGLYVLKEAFEKEFLRLYFGSSKGNLYDGGFLRDIDQDLNRESGEGKPDGADLTKLREAVNETDPAKRWERLHQILDVESFITYTALSVMLADWDGYPLNRNNYRIYFRPHDGRAVFLPHGMDQLFQRSNMEMDASWQGSVAWALFGNPQGLKLYQARCRQVFTNLFSLPSLTNRVAELSTVLAKADPHISSRADDLVYQMQSRHRTLRRDPFIQPPPPVTNNAAVKP
jgi:hypothetical protein